VLPDFDHEMTATRRLLERLPEADLAWRPHEKSYTLGELALHLPRLVSWGRSILNEPAYDLTRGGSQPPSPATRAEVLAAFDEVVASVRQSLIDRPEAYLMSIWELRRGTQVLMSMPRITALRRFVIHHLIHHRGQLTVYLRLRGVPLPPLYGPTADERM
jgi:uncharacterized damage-inducible protein DinB